MSAKILGISGSPIPESNTDAAVQAVLAASGMEPEFIKLSDFHFEACRACLGCKDNNTCTIQDDAQILAAKFREARAFVIGGYTPYSSLDARTKAFMERMYCLRHKTGLNRGKVGAAVITTACRPDLPGLPPAAQTAGAQFAFWMMEEGMVNVGSMIVLGNVPCIRCGYGDSCELSGVKMLHGAEATVESIGVNAFSAQQALQDEATALGRKIREAVGN